MAANLNVFKTSKKGCILSKSNFPFAEVHWARYRIRKENNKKNDDMGTLMYIDCESVDSSSSALKQTSETLRKKSGTFVLSLLTSSTVVIPSKRVALVSRKTDFG